MKPLFQRGLTLPVGPEQSVLAVYYPRLKDEAAPTIDALVDGHGFRLTSPHGVDYVFCSPTAIEYAEGDVAFTGTVGVIQVRGDAAILTLGATGTIRYADQTITVDAETGD